MPTHMLSRPLTKYFDKQKAVKSTAATYDDEMAARLWAVSEEMTRM